MIFILVGNICIRRSADVSKALSVDLCTRVLAAVSAGSSPQEAAERFGVGVASVSRWRNFQIEKEMFVPDLLVVTAILTRRKPMLN